MPLLYNTYSREASTYEVGIGIALPKINNPLKVDYRQIRQQTAQNGLGGTLANAIPKAHADSTVPIRVVILIPIDDPFKASVIESQNLATAVHDWYCAQVGTCYRYADPYGDTAVWRGSQTQAYYMTCHWNTCPTDPLGNVLRNVAEKDAGYIYRPDVDTVIVTGWSTGEFSSGACGVGMLGGNLAAIDLFEPTPWNPFKTLGAGGSINESFCQPGHDMAHELGHTFGLSHTSNGTLMDGPTPDVPSQPARPTATSMTSLNRPAS